MHIALKLLVELIRLNLPLSACKTGLIWGIKNSIFFRKAWDLGLFFLLFFFNHTLYFFLIIIVVGNFLSGFQLYKSLSYVLFGMQVLLILHACPNYWLMVILTFCSHSLHWLLLNGSYLFQDLYIHVGWPLYRKYGHAFEVRMFITLGGSFLSSNFAVGDLNCIMCRHSKLLWLILILFWILLPVKSKKLVLMDRR